MKKFAHILVVDDVKDNVKILCNLLDVQGYETSSCLSGNEAIQMASEICYDLILLDIMMPIMDGFETAEILQSNESTCEIPIIFLTAKSDIESLSKGFDCGGVDYITKPFNKRELLARVRIHVDLQKKKKELLEINQTKDKLFSIISHDLKSPFNSLMGLSELLSNEYYNRLDNEVQEIVKNIHYSSKTLFTLLESLLEWSRSQSGKISYTPIIINVSDILNKIYDLYQPVCRNKGIRFSVEVAPQLHCSADVYMLETILRNIVSNAIKFTSRDGYVVISARDSGKHIQFSVADNGIGIPPHDIPKIFDISQDYKTKGTNNEKGSGLGLIICNDFIEKHNSSIQIKSEPGSGSVFSFNITKVN